MVTWGWCRWHCVNPTWFSIHHGSSFIFCGAPNPDPKPHPPFQGFESAAPCELCLVEGRAWNSFGMPDQRRASRAKLRSFETYSYSANLLWPPIISSYLHISTKNSLKHWLKKAKHPWTNPWYLPSSGLRHVGWLRDCVALVRGGGPGSHHGPSMGPQWAQWVCKKMWRNKPTLGGKSSWYLRTLCPFDAALGGYAGICGIHQYPRYPRYTPFSETPKQLGWLEWRGKCSCESFQLVWIGTKARWNEFYPRTRIPGYVWFLYISMRSIWKGGQIWPD